MVNSVNRTTTYIKLNASKSQIKHTQRECTRVKTKYELLLLLYRSSPTYVRVIAFKRSWPAVQLSTNVVAVVPEVGLGDGMLGRRVRHARGDQAEQVPVESLIVGGGRRHGCC